MKPVHFIPPVIALAVAGVLVGAQRNSISKLESESSVLKKHIEAAKSRPASTQEPSRPDRAGLSGKEKEAIDWKEVAESLSDMKATGGMRDMRKMMSFQRKLQAMDADELVAALEQIAALELDDAQRMMLEGMIIGPLVMKDPELALTRFAWRIGDEQSGMSWQLANALGQWAKKDQAAAIAWFDEQIAAGIFASKSLDGKSRVRISFEANLVSQFLKNDPEAAAVRISALPADQRKDVFSGFGFRQLPAEEHAAFADLVRSQLPQKDQLEILGKQASTIAMTGSLEKVGEYLDRIGATPEERVRSAEDAARSSIEGKGYQSKITAERIDSMREWLGTQSPASVDKITGESIGSVSRNGAVTKFSEAAGLVMEYHGKSGGDDILVGFLDKAPVWQNKEEARVIAEKISDLTKRGKALEKLK